jgi:ABC-type transport system involved in multi-copper enzyme maturation permease subunit
MTNYSNPIIERELITTLRKPRSLAMQLAPAVVLALLILMRWPTDSQVGLSGLRALDVFRLFAYGLLGTILLLVPAFPAMSIVREKKQGTLALLLNSPLSGHAIYLGKLFGSLGFVFLPLIISLPAAAACYAMGGISLTGDLLALYVVLSLATIQYTTLALLVSTVTANTDSALRLTYGSVLAMCVLCVGPYQFVQGWSPGLILTISEWIRCLSPIPAVMEILEQRDLGAQGLISASGTPLRYCSLAVLTAIGFAVFTLRNLKQTMFDRPRPQGVITDDRSQVGQWVRRGVFLVDPQRRKTSIGPLTNPVMVKEFRSRRFGRVHWLIRLIAFCAMISLGLTWLATTGTFAWGPETIGGIMVVLQIALVVVFTPSLAAGLFSAEHESGGWTLLRMTPLSPGRIMRGKLISVLWTLALLLLATLPGYAVMIWIQPILTQQICYVLVCLVLGSLFALTLSATVSSFFKRTAPATIVAYAVLVLVWGGTMLVWLARDAPFGHETVATVLVINPMAAALSVLDVANFGDYELVPSAWWATGMLSILCLVVITVQLARFTRPQ